MAGERTPDTTGGKSSDDDISLREHLQRQLDSQSAAINRRITDLATLLDERYEIQKEQVDRLAKQQQEALDKAERATEKRFDAVNEFRQQLNDQAHTFMPRTESISRHERTQEQMERAEQHTTESLSAINRRLDTMQGIIQGQQLQKSEGRNNVVDARAWVAFGITVVLLFLSIAGFVIANTVRG